MSEAAADRGVAPRVSPPKRPAWWRILRPLIAIAIPPPVPWAAIVFAAETTGDAIIPDAAGWAYLLVMPLLMVPVGWVVGALMTWGHRDGVRGIGPWLGTFALAGAIVGAVVMTLGGLFAFHFLMSTAVISGALIGALMWAMLRWLP
ncbi:MAG: hypothetical protein WD044_08930 [Dongiaceae bacterium]